MKEDKLTSEARLLINLYFEGLTTLQQEERLRRLLSDPAIKGEEADQARAVMSFAAVATDPVAAPKNRGRLYGAIASVAASVTLVVVLGSLFFTNSANTEYIAYVNGNRIENPEEVMSMVNDDLSLFSEASASVDNEIDQNLNAFSSAL